MLTVFYYDSYKLWWYLYVDELVILKVSNLSNLFISVKKKSNGNFNLILRLVIIPISVFMGNSGI